MVARFDLPFGDFECVHPAFNLVLQAVNPRMRKLLRVIRRVQWWSVVELHGMQSNPALRRLNVYQAGQGCRIGLSCFIRHVLEQAMRT